MSQRLWDVKHPYYCNKGNYFAKDCIAYFRSWDDFHDSEGHADMDLNLLFRWDWERPLDDDGMPVEWQHDENYRESTLNLFYMGQRKGLFRSAVIEVCRADEPRIREWLRLRFEYLLTLWQPFPSERLGTPDEHSTGRAAESGVDPGRVQP